jgi:hypothetical protein
MKKSVGVLLLFVSMAAFAQQKVTVDMRTDSKLEDELPGEMLFAFSEFSDARLIFKNGRENTAKININIYTSEIVFIAPSNQPMILSNAGDLKRVVVGSSVWLPVDNTFGEMIYEEDITRVIRVPRTKISAYPKGSGYADMGGSSSPWSSTSLTSVSSDNQSRMSLSTGKYDFTKTVSYWLVSGNQQVVADLKGFRKVFAPVRKELDKYLKESPVDFKKEEDILRLTNVCSGLQK